MIPPPAAADRTYVTNAICESKYKPPKIDVRHPWLGVLRTALLPSTGLDTVRWPLGAARIQARRSCGLLYRQVKERVQLERPKRKQKIRCVFSDIVVPQDVSFETWLSFSRGLATRLISPR